MRRRKRFSCCTGFATALIVALLLALASVTGARPAEPDTPPLPWYQANPDGSLSVKLYVFWSTGCPHCRRAVRFIRTDLAPERPWLDVALLEVSEPDNAQLYDAFARALDVEAAYVPAFFYCGAMFHGYDRDQTTGRFLRDSLERCHARLIAESPAPASTPDIAPPPSLGVPFLGPVDLETLSLPVMTLLLAGLDAFNPCAFFVLLFLLSLMIHACSRSRMLVVGGVFVVFSGLLYFAFMAAWLNLFMVIGHLSAVTVGAGLIAVLVGALNVKDYAWSGRGVRLSIPERAKPGLYQRVRDLVGAVHLPVVLAGTVALAVAANTYELLCTAGFPLVFTRILTLQDLPQSMYYLYLGLYNLVYVLPLLVIVVGFAVTLGARRLQAEEGRLLKLLSGLMMLGLGVVLLLAPDWLNHPLTAFALVAGAVLATLLVALIDRLSGGTRRPAA